jgi:hypothetical protein
MEIRVKCTVCCKEHVADQPEGTTSATFKCDCGYGFSVLIKLDPFGISFLYGIEELKRQRYSNATVRFATSFEAFQKGYVEAALKSLGTPRDLARFLVYELDLERGKYSRLAGHIFHQKLRHPDVSIRNRAVHHGSMPSKEKATKLADAVLNVIGEWIFVAEKNVSARYTELWYAYSTGKRSPKDASDFDYSVFDFKMAHLILSDQWQSVRQSL